jgi:hypothetical protein
MNEMKSQNRSALVVLALLLVMGLATSGVSFAQDPPAPAPQAAPPQGQATGGPPQQAGPRPPAPGEDKPFDDVVKDMEVIKGLFTFYRKADENKVLMEIQPDQLDQVFLFAATQEQATGERGFYASQVAGDGPFYFRRVGKNIQMLVKNVSFTAEPGTPSGRSTSRSYPDSIVGSAKMQSKPHPDRKSVLVDAADLFLTDLPGFVPALNQAYQPTNYRFDKNNSAFGTVKGFPESVLLDVWLHYATDNPRSISLTLPDSRSVPILMKYMVSALKKTDYKPRMVDDRVGYFHTVQQDYSSDKPSTPFVRYVARWDVRKSDPNAALSPAKEPIVFWLENTIPVEYREYFKEGVLLWNKAYEKVGIKDALVVKQQPDDADWDPADTRYNTIRWFAGIDATFAIGPSRANPFTGQIYDADIGFSEGIIRVGARRAGEEIVGPVGMEGEEQPMAPRAPNWLNNQRMTCSYINGLAQQTAMAFDMLEIRGMMSPDQEEKLMREFIVEVTAHEVGHTLGLRHNFRASTILKPEELNDTSKTAQYSQSASVMDYNPIVIAGKGEKQGDYLPTTLGPYDYWAIEYGYKPISGNEKAELNKVASRVADRWLPYSTDEDARGTFSAISIDPRANQYDQSDDPIAYFRTRIGILNELWGSMEAKLAKQGEGYQVMRRSMNRSLGEYNRALLTSSKYVGGVYHYRDHVGDPNGRSPYVPVPAAKQREAMDFLKTYAFSEKAFQLPPGLVNKLAIERLPGLDFITYFVGSQRMDYPWHDQVLNLQRNVLNRMFHPVTLGRMLDNELRFAANEKAFTMADMFSGLDAAIWSELGTPAAKVSSLRRNLQREHVRQLIRLVMRPAPAPAGIGGPPVGVVIPIPPTPRPPEDATTLARASLVNLQAKIRQALSTVTDAITRAHLQETNARIDATLKAQIEKPIE